MILSLAYSHEFPNVELTTEDGLLAYGGDLSISRLLKAYQSGIFPWYSHPDPILWWSPDPRMVLHPQDLKIPRSLKSVLKKNEFQLTMDQAFEEVISQCQKPRPNQEGTWIMPEVKEAYCELHHTGYAHSIEVWRNNELAGGLYGVSLGHMFAGESMFTLDPNASKWGFVKFVENAIEMGIQFIDCQVYTNHLARFGAVEIPRSLFLKQLQTALKSPTKKGSWASWC